MAAKSKRIRSLRGPLWKSTASALELVRPRRVKSELESALVEGKCDTLTSLVGM